MRTEGAWIWKWRTTTDKRRLSVWLLPRPEESPEAVRLACVSRISFLEGLRAEERLKLTMTTDRLNALVVDDEPSFRRVLRTSLTASGFAIEEARSGEEALAILARSTFDLVLLDVNMPGMGGVAACREIRAHMPKIGIVMVTVQDGESEMVRALEAGADDYITKPIRLRELVARLRAVSRRLQTDDASRANNVAGRRLGA